MVNIVNVALTVFQADKDFQNGHHILLAQDTKIVVGFHFKA